MRHLGLFEGIGGFSLAAKAIGWQTAAWCEINPFCQQVLKYHFPDAEGYSDITKTDFSKYANTIDILTGGFPCQPYSLAGKRKGNEDDRHLWPQMLRIIREVKPRWVVGENVFGIVSWDEGLVFEQVQADLEAEGYEVQPYVLPACGIDAPHRRDRVWFVGCAKHYGSSTTEIRGNEQESPFETRAHEVGELARAIGLQSGSPSYAKSSGWSSEVGRKLREQKQNNRPKIFAESNPNSRSEITPYPTNSGSENMQRKGENEVSGFEITPNSNSEYGREQLELPSSNAAGTRQELSRSSNLTSHPHSRRQSGKEHRKEESGLSTKESLLGDWENFPTQSPVCGGDDGIPSRLVGITFSKWRNESIKAFGNAIVPQVAHQIFQAIHEYESM